MCVGGRTPSQPSSDGVLHCELMAFSRSDGRFLEEKGRVVHRAEGREANDDETDG